MAALSTDAALSAHALNVSPNMGRPLFDDVRVASFWITSQCSTSIPFSMRRISAAIQFTDRPKPAPGAHGAGGLPAILAEEMRPRTRSVPGGRGGMLRARHIGVRNGRYS